MAGILPPAVTIKRCKYGLLPNDEKLEQRKTKVNMQNSNSQKRTSRRTRTVIQTSALVVLAVPFILSFSVPQLYQFWLLNADIMMIGLLLLGGGLMYQSTFADAIGIVTSGTRRFYTILGIVFIVVAIASVLLNLKAL